MLLLVSQSKGLVLKLLPNHLAKTQSLGKDYILPLLQIYFKKTEKPVLSKSNVKK